MKKQLRAILPFLLLAAPVAAQELPADQAVLKAHVQFLASDALRGREAGSPEFNIASEYMAAQMAARGLKPGAAGAWFQPVTLASYKPANPGAWTLRRGTDVIPFQPGMDYFSATAGGIADFAATGELVFAGYGISYPQGGIDDFKGLNVRGKIVAILAGAPKGLPSDVAAHLSDYDQRAAAAARLGAKGVILLESAEGRAQYPFESIAPSWNYTRNGWAGPDGRLFGKTPGAPGIGYVSTAGAEKLFQGGRIKWIDVIAAEKAGKKIPTGPLPGTLSVTSKLNIETSPSHNVVGLLEGSDPVLKNEYIVLTAHLDHVGVGTAVNGDRIYNGAMDNAVGNAVMLEVARAFQQSGKRPRRSILFVALTAEEKGLIGSDYFVNFPVVPRDRIVANINMDMPIFTYKVEDVVVLGAERSSLGPVIERAAAEEGLKVVPDPLPEENFFVRSDHYSFVKAGIPAVSIDTGPGGAGAAAQKKFLEENYHKPSDQIDLPFDWPSVAKFARLNYAVARALADDDKRPRWNKGDFFGLTFDGYGAKTE
ncbi:M20/M25/M40 family metallo-hydrolase [Sphingomonas soli]|uniref:M20/M25/M40 family metallo-hydrolase n=1 Tax=Sphingomonas soli TaxID=266127 RepID=UPI00082ED781|nr:M20/M25/M40 family metallo-hydrolase [Sphingomonas soli]